MCKIIIKKKKVLIVNRFGQLKKSKLIGILFFMEFKMEFKKFSILSKWKIDGKLRELNKRKLIQKKFVNLKKTEEVSISVTFERIPFHFVA